MRVDLIKEPSKVDRMQRILFLANISNAIYKSSNLFTEAKIFDEGEELLLNIFPHSLSSSWPGVTLTMHTMIADEKPVDLCPLFIDAHNSKVPLSAYRWCIEILCEVPNHTLML